MDGVFKATHNLIRASERLEPSLAQSAAIVVWTGCVCMNGFDLVQFSFLLEGIKTDLIIHLTDIKRINRSYTTGRRKSSRQSESSCSQDSSSASQMTLWRCELLLYAAFAADHESQTSSTACSEAGRVWRAGEGVCLRVRQMGRYSTYDASRGHDDTELRQILLRRVSQAFHWTSFCSRGAYS